MELVPQSLLRGRFSLLYFWNKLLDTTVQNEIVYDSSLHLKNNCWTQNWVYNPQKELHFQKLYQLWACFESQYRNWLNANYLQCYAARNYLLWVQLTNYSRQTFLLAIDKGNSWSPFSHSVVDATINMLWNDWLLFYSLIV